MNHSTVAYRSPRFARIAAAALASAMLAGGTVVATSATAQAATTFPASFISTTGTTWSYSDDNTDPSAGDANRLSWTTSAFDDTNWKSATGSFGAKNGAATGIGTGFPITTKLNQYINGSSAPDVPTYHFRTSFDVTSAQLAELSSLTGTVTFDDAVQIFVNGTKIAGYVDDRVEAAPEADRNLMYAGNNAGDPVTHTLSIPASALAAGENVLSVALYQDRASSSDIYFDLKSLSPVLTSTPAALSDIVLTIGATEKERNVTWYSSLDNAQEVQFAPESAQTGGAFPAAAATSSAASGGATSSGEFRRSANIAGLAENTSYVYRVGSDVNGWSATYSFSTGTFTGDYDFLFFGDPQIGASGNVASDQAGWTDTLKIAQDTYPSSELLFSAGDQVQSAGNEAQYEAFLAPDQLREIPLVPTNGNHDVGSKAYEQHYTVPNNDPASGAATSSSSSGGDYWFMYKDVLYLNINTNNGDVASHQAFLERVVAAEGARATWKVLAFHHSIYSVASHTNDTAIKDLRATLPTIISDLGIDLVLQGHDHSYTRSYLIKNGAIADGTELAGQSVVEAEAGEVLYVTANSASGSKYYDVQAPTAFFASVINQEKVRNYSHIEVTDNAITVTTLRSQQSGSAKPVNSVVDEVTLTRADVVAPVLAVPSTSSVKAATAFDPMAGITATDAVDGDLTSAVTVTGAVDTGVLGEYTLIYSVTDAAGNVSTATRVVTVVTGSFVQTETPVISGPASVGVGATLTATSGSFTPAPTALSYQWLRNGLAIAGATSASYVTTAADAGASISARILVTRSGIADETVVTAPVAVAADPVVVPTPTPTGTPAPTDTPTSSLTSSSTAAPSVSVSTDPGSLALTGFNGIGAGTLAGLLVMAGAVFLVLRRSRV